MTAVAASPDMMLSPDALRTIATLVQDEAGIMLPEAKATLVASRLASAFRTSGAKNFTDYATLLQIDAAARTAAIEALTTNHTKFFREAHHFDHVARVVRPVLLRRLRQGSRVRLWSAGSSSGEEVYSLAMTLLGEEQADSDVVVAGDVVCLATDINRQVLQTGRDASYPALAAASIPSGLARRWMERHADQLRCRPALKALVRFRRLNLLADWPMRGQFDAIFCRNTMIYFDEATKAELLTRFADRLAPGGYLYIGHAERVVGPAVEQLEPAGPTLYRRVEP